MGFTPASRSVMSTRAGDQDPGLAYYLSRTERMSAARFQRIVNRESGLLGVSGTRPDNRDLVGRKEGDVRAAGAVALSCCQAKKGIGSFAAVPGGLDTPVFSVASARTRRSPGRGSAMDCKFRESDWKIGGTRPMRT